jgi:hypothetical protein
MSTRPLQVGAVASSSSGGGGSGTGQMTPTGKGTGPGFGSAMEYRSANGTPVPGGVQVQELQSQLGRLMEEVGELRGVVRRVEGLVGDDKVKVGSSQISLFFFFFSLVPFPLMAVRYYCLSSPIPPLLSLHCTPAFQQPNNTLPICALSYRHCRRRGRRWCRR